jgi:hypothetical protein
MFLRNIVVVMVVMMMMMMMMSLLYLRNTMAVKLTVWNEFVSTIPDGPVTSRQHRIIRRYFELPEILSAIHNYRNIVGPCHHCMAHPQVMDGKDGIQIQRVADS